MTEPVTAVADRPRVPTVFATTLGHDLMALVLEMVRTLPDHWLRLNEDQQKKAIERVRVRVAEAVSDAARIVGRAQFPAVAAQMDSITIKDGVKITLAMAANQEGRHDLYDAKGKDVLIVLTEPQRWLERMDEIQAQADQLQLWQGDYDPSVDQPGYRRDQPPSAPGFMSWADLKKKLAGGEITQQQAEEAFGGPLPAEEPKPESKTPKVEERIDVFIEILQGNGEWQPARVEQLKRGIVYRIAGDTNVFTCMSDPQPIGEDGYRVSFDTELCKPMKFGSAADHAAAAAGALQGKSPLESGRDVEKSAQLGALLERLFGMGMTISLGTLQTFTPEQIRCTEEWVTAYLADPNGCKIARPHWLPIPDARGGDDSTTAEG